MGVHVDDVLTCGVGKEYDDDIDTISKMFKWGHWHEDEFTYCGLHVVQERETLEVYVDLEEYCNNIEEVKTSKGRLNQKDDKLTPC